MSRAQIHINGAFRSVACKTRWTISNWNSVLLPLSIILWTMRDINIFPTPTMNEGPRESRSWLWRAASSFKYVDMTKKMIATLLLESVAVAVVHVVLSLNLRGRTHHLLRKLKVSQLNFSLSWKHFSLFHSSSHILRPNNRAWRKRFLVFFPSLRPSLPVFSCPSP